MKNINKNDGGYKLGLKRFHPPCGQEVAPYVDGFVVHLEAAEDAVHGRALRVTITGDDAVLPEHLNTDASPQIQLFIITSL